MNEFVYSVNIITPLMAALFSQTGGVQIVGRLELCGANSAAQVLYALDAGAGMPCRLVRRFRGHEDAVLCLAQAGWAWQRRAANWGLPAAFDPLEGWILGATPPKEASSA